MTGKDKLVTLTKEEQLHVFALYHKAPIAIFDDNELPLRCVPAEIEAIDFYSNKLLCERIWRDDIEKIKLILKQVRFMSDGDIYNYCKAFYNTPFAGSMPKDWVIERGFEVFKVMIRDNLHSYSIDVFTGNIKMFRASAPSSLGKQSYAIQWLLKNKYAMPLYFDQGHEYNGKNAFDLKIAIPDSPPINQLLMQIYNKDSQMVEEWHNDKIFHNIDLGDLATYNHYVGELQKQIVTL